MKYDFAQIEQRWQAHWAKQRTFATLGPGDEGHDPEKPKFYVLDFFPYPSGVGLHVGHPLGYIATDILARFKRMQGFNVLHPMGFDAFGLPAEQFAIEHGVHPRVTTEQNIENMVRQLKRLGMSYDWDRCFATTDPGYYKWTQWIFLQMYHAWYDAGVAPSGRARPIEELVQDLEAENLYVGPDGELVPAATRGFEPIEGNPIGARKWHELSRQEQRDLLDSHRLAYMAEVPVNWCPALGTVLANEEVTNEGRSERGNHPVQKRPLKQWMLRISAYAQRLIDDLDSVDWPEPIKLMQRNWIGRSEGALVHFQVAGTEPGSEAAGDESGFPVISVFTTRPDTLFGATYMVLAPEHPLVESITTPPHRDAVLEYQQFAAARSDLDRQVETGQKTGVFTGAYAHNPVNGESIPIWVADYVMMGYGTGAIMAVPAHDQRDHDFARKFDLPIRQVVSAGDAKVDIRDQAWAGDGIGMNSANDEVLLNDVPTPQGKRLITEWIESRGFGTAQVQYKLRDWLFSRQRYWGEPFPILHSPDGEVVAVDEAELPVELPQIEDFKPRVSEAETAPGAPETGDADGVPSPLAQAPESWKYVEVNGKRFRRELNTMPQWAGSCWYYLRFLDPRNEDRLVGREAEAYWMVSSTGSVTGGEGDGERIGRRHSAGGVDLYVGGAEHAVLHLLYARFWHKVLYDLGHVSTPEPFARLFNQGYIQAYAYRDRRGICVPADEVVEQDGKFFHNADEVSRDFGKMGKSLKNAVTPDDVFEQYGCDTLRLYEMYMGPLNQSKLWKPRDIVGVHRFLKRLWRNFIDEDTGELLVVDEPPSLELRKHQHRAVKRITEAMESMSFNVAIAALIELNNKLVAMEKIPRQTAETILHCLVPMAPHICEELGQKMGHRESIAGDSWPTYDPSLLVEDQIEYPVQVNGKLRGRITVPADADDATIQAAAREDPKVAATVGHNPILKVIIVKDRLVNLVT